MTKSLTTCFRDLERAGTPVRPQDKEAVLAYSRQFRGRGSTTDEAAVLAVDKRDAEVAIEEAKLVAAAAPPPPPPPAERDWSKATPDELDAEIQRLDAERRRLDALQRTQDFFGQERADTIHAMDKAHDQATRLARLLPQEPEPEEEQADEGPFIPPADWRERMYQARLYARELGINPVGMPLDLLVKTVEAHPQSGASWWKSLTAAGHERVLAAAGLKLPSRVAWHNLSPENQVLLLEKRGAEAEAAAPAPPSAEQQAATAARAAIEERRASRELERTAYRELAADPAMVGKPSTDLAAILTERLANVPGAPPPLRIALLARALHKHLAARAAELAKAAFRNPAVRQGAIAAAIVAHYTKVDTPTTEQHTAFIGGFDHALAGKTKSTLSGDHLADMITGYEAAQRWIGTEEGAAWYEGRSVNKLENTGVDLRRWHDKLRAQMKADESDVDKAWKQIERATARADLFAPLLPPGVTPGFQVYVEHVRKNTSTFREFLDSMYWRGDQASTGRYSSGKTNVDLILEGTRRPDDLSDDDRDRWENDQQVRIKWLQDAAGDYQQGVRDFIGFAQGATSVKEAAERFSERFVDQAAVGKGALGLGTLGPAGRQMLTSHRRIFTGNANDLSLLRVDSNWTANLIDVEKTIAPPERSTPLLPPKLDSVKRDGPDVRQGKDTTPQAAKAKFSFADIGFGTWVGAKQDQDHLNYADDAFTDLAKHFGAPLEGIGFGGQLHFTIGALGHGKFAAHFQAQQPSPNGPVPVINLTNTRGDGTVYHEWIHALDHFLGGAWKSNVRARLVHYLTNGVSTPKQVEKYADRFLFGGSFWQGNKRGDKVHAAMLAMRRPQHMSGASAYKRNADQLGKDYWGNEHELIARAAEAWAGDTLGHTNTYLVNPAWSGENMVTEKAGHRGTPYPTGEERRVFNLLYTALAKSIKWEGGKPTVKIADFEANLPDEITAGDRRRRELMDHTAMLAYLQEQKAKRATEAAARAQTAAEQKAREEAEIDDLAAQKLAELEPPAPPPTPPVVDSPPASETKGPLSDDDLESLLDQAAAELREEAAEQPDVAPPGEASPEPAPAPPPVAAAKGWKQADLEEVLAKANNPDLIAVADNTGMPNVPTIHEVGRMGKTEHLGDGMFDTTGRDEAGKPWSLTWDGGGAMRRTAGGMAWTNVGTSGRHPFPSGVKRALDKAIDQIVADRRIAANQPRRPPAAPPAPAPAEPTPSAAALIAEAAKLGVSGLDESLTALSKLFGGKPGQFNSGIGFDEDTYKAALPHFKASLAKFQASGSTLVELFKMLIKQFGDEVRPYLKRFAKDEALTAQLGTKPTASMQIAQRVQANLLSGRAFDWRELFGIADEAYGGTQAEGKYTPKDAYDAMEAGMNRYIMTLPREYNPTVGPEDALRAVAELHRVTQLLPTQTKRTAEQDQYQQYSTVPAFAFAANWVANIEPGETMGEFSAGIGGLAVFAKNAGARLVLNELSSRRAALLQEVFPDARVFHENAEQIDNILPDDIQPSVVVINPPFSASAATGRHTTQVGAEHIEQALKRLVDGGRLVGIVGEGMAMDKPAFATWWAKIGKQYDVKAAIPMDGSGYAKYGTTYDNVLLVIDKVKPSGTPPVTTAATNYTELIGLLEKVRDERPRAAAPTDGAAATQPDPDRGERQPAPDGGRVQPGTPAGPGGAPGLGDTAPGGRSGVGAGGRTGRGPGGNARTGGNATDVVGPGAGGRGDTGRGGTNPDAVGHGPDATGGQSGLTVGSTEVAAGALTDSVFEGYTPQRLQIPGAHPHPGALVQSAAMASVLPPAATYTPNLPRATVTQGLLSLAQLEAVVYAGQAHAQLLDTTVDDKTATKFNIRAGDTYRRGFFIGDGTGVGKGREISGILLDNLRQGRKKHVWVSEKQRLIRDAKRDFKGAGGNEDLLFNQNKTNADGTIDSTKNGVIYTTYSTLRAGTASAPGGFKKGVDVEVGRAIGTVFSPDRGVAKLVKINTKNNTVTVEYKGKRTVHPFAQILSIDGDEHWIAAVRQDTGQAQSRIDQLVKWLGPNFDGVIAFDEAHNAGNAEAIKGDRGFSEPSAQALAVIELQARLPKARVVYVSATGATEVSNLAFATRLGLWGPGTPFPTVQTFIAEMTAGGLATMELVARDMKQAGSYMARSLSFDGVTYSRTEHELTPTQRQIYDRLAEAWQVTLQNFMAALQATGVIDPTGTTRNPKALAAAKSAYWGAQQRFFNQIITSMQMLPTIVEEIERDIAAGHAVVLQLVNTNEAQQERALAKRKDDDESTDLEDLDLTPRDQLIQMVQKSFPVQQYQQVIDPSGKTVSVPVVNSDGTPVLSKDAVRMREALLKDLIEIRVPDGPLETILNNFGTGVVAEVTGRKRRVVRKPDADGNITAQTETRGAAATQADADDFMGDKKRILVFSDAGGTGFSFQADLSQKNQRKRVHYLLQPGWRANKAVQGLGRTHRTNQASAPHYKLASTDIPAHKRFLSSIARRLDQLGALTKGQRDTSSGGLFSEKDNLESQYASQAVRRLIEDAQRGQVEGVEFQDFLRQMGLESIVNPSTQQIAENDFPKTQQFLNRLLSLKLGMQEVVFNAFIARMEEQIEQAAARGQLDTGMQTIRALSTKVTREDVVHVDERTGAETKYIELALTQPTRMYPFPDEKNQGGKITWITNLKSGRVWGKIKSGTSTLKDGSVVDRYRMLGTGGQQIKTDADFKPGVYSAPMKTYEARELWDTETEARPKTYEDTAHMIVGAMLPIWDRLKTPGSQLMVARTQTSDGRRLLGRLVAERDVPDLLRRLNVDSAESRLAPEVVMARLLKGEVGELANGWKLRRARVSDEVRIEISTERGMIGRALGAELTGMGMIAEQISWADRYFVPNATALAKLLKNRPLIGLVDPKKGADDDSGAVMQDIQRPRAAPAERTEAFYSELARKVDAAPMNSAPALGWGQYLRSLVGKGVKADEIAWTGVEDWLKLQPGKVSKAEVQAFLNANGVHVTETVLPSTAATVHQGAIGRLTAEYQAWLTEQGLPQSSADELLVSAGLEGGVELTLAQKHYLIAFQGRWDDAGEEDAGEQPGETKFSTYQLPGGKNYREILLTLPERTPMTSVPVDVPRGWGDTDGGMVGIEHHGGEDDYRGSHWDQPNVLAHVRLNERTDADGKRVLFVEEIQSDWAQAGRRAREKNAKLPVYWRLFISGVQMGRFGSEKEATDKMHQLQENARFGGVEPTPMSVSYGPSESEREKEPPTAPFIDKTDAWVALAIKRIVKLAVDEGFDRVAFITGQQSVDRYKLSRQVSSIEVIPRTHAVTGEKTRAVIVNMEARPALRLGVDKDGVIDNAVNVPGGGPAMMGKPLEDVIGKAMAERVMGMDSGTIAGEGLDIGGEGMRAFYDKIVPAVARDVVKKLGGGALHAVHVARPNAGRRDEILAELGRDDRTSKLEHLGFDITDAMREKAAGGLPLFDTRRDKLVRLGAQLARQGYERADVPRVQAAAELRKLIDDHAAGKVSDGAFMMRVKILSDRLTQVSDAKAANRLMGERVRDVDHVRAQLLQARRRGDLDHEGVEFALWALAKNPALAANLAVSIRTPAEGSRDAADYNPASETIRLLKGLDRPDTVVHEILHHAERMMPPDMQGAIRREWAKALGQALSKGTPEQIEALKNIPLAIAGDKAAHDVLVKAIQNGPLNYAEHYPLINPSEFWAVNGARLLGQHHGAKDSIWQRIRQWLREMVQKVRQLLGLPSTAPVIRAMHYVTDASHFTVLRGGRFESERMLSDARDLMQDITRPAAPAAGAAPAPRSPWLDPLNRLQFAPGAWLYRKLADGANPLLAKIGLRPMSDALKDQLRTMNLQVQKAQETAAGIATEAQALSQEDRDMISDIVEQEMADGVTPPAHAVQLAALMSETLSAQSRELVELGMLSQDAATRWDGRYLPRFYESKLRKQVGAAWTDAIRRLTGRTSTLKGIKGNHLKMRGKSKVIGVEELADFTALGWEIRDPGYEAGESATVRVWRDFTREERQQMGEIRDAPFRFVMGYMQTQRDLALGRLFANMAADPAQSLRKDVAPDDWVQVPSVHIEGTGVNRYGKLAGRYVPRETLSHLSQIEEASSEAWTMYRKALSVWKEGKTVLNPTSHVNNTVGNLTMAHLAGVSYHRADLYLGALKDFIWKAPAIKEAHDAGLFLGSMTHVELLNSMPPELRDLVARSDPKAVKGARFVYNLLTLGMRRPLGAAYAFEDTYFRYLLYKDARARGLTPNEAVDRAQRFIFTYDDLPRGARRIRDFGIPFFAYTYKLIPVLAHTALAHPVRFAAPATLIWIANAMAYALATGDDDDDWAERIRKYATDAEYRRKARELEDEEQKHLPPWMRGVTAMFTRKTIRLGTDKLTKLQLFIDVQRLIPGTDLNDVTGHVPGAMWWPQILTPSHPVITAVTGVMANTDLWTGKQLVDTNDTTAESTAKRADWLWKLAAPAIAPGGALYEKTIDAIANASGGDVAWLPAAMTESHTGIGKDGLPVQPHWAALQAVGIKIRPQDLDKSERIDEAMKMKMIREIVDELRKLKRLEGVGAIRPEVFERERDRARTKIEHLKEGLTVEGTDR